MLKQYGSEQHSALATEAKERITVCVSPERKKHLLVYLLDQCANGDITSVSARVLSNLLLHMYNVVNLGKPVIYLIHANLQVERKVPRTQRVTLAALLSSCTQMRATGTSWATTPPSSSSGTRCWWVWRLRCSCAASGQGFIPCSFTACFLLFFFLCSCKCEYPDH